MPYPFNYPSVTIANGTALSPVVYIGAGELVSIDMPAAWTAASLSFQKSTDGVNFEEMFDSGGNALVVAAAANSSIVFGNLVTPTGDPQSASFQGAPYIKIRSGTSATPVNQGADRLIKVTVQKYQLP